jgi:enoyl-CoA hydratase/carnithine racemase
MADRRINRKLAAILAADVVGYSRLMEADEAGTLGALKRHRETIFDPTVVAHNGRIVKLAQELAEPGKAVDVAMAMAEKVARQPPISVAMTKMTVNRLAYALDDLASHMDVDQFAIASKTEDHLEGVAAFLERRKPTFRGR